MGDLMRGNRRKLRLFYLALCLSQLIVMGTGLGVAYQVERSYSRNITYEKTVDREHQAIDELQVFARSATPEQLDLDDNTSGPQQLSQIAYASRIFLAKAQKLLTETESDPSSPMYPARSAVRTMIEHMRVVAEQSQLAGEAWAQEQPALARAHLTYADRAADRVNNAMYDIHIQMSHTSDELLGRDEADARRAGLVNWPALRP